MGLFLYPFIRRLVFVMEAAFIILDAGETLSACVNQEKGFYFTCCFDPEPDVLQKSFTLFDILLCMKDSS